MDYLYPQPQEKDGWNGVFVFYKNDILYPQFKLSTTALLCNLVINIWGQFGCLAISVSEIDSTIGYINLMLSKLMNLPGRL